MGKDTDNFLMYANNFQKTVSTYNEVFAGIADLRNFGVSEFRNLRIYGIFESISPRGFGFYGQRTTVGRSRLNWWIYGVSESRKLRIYGSTEFSFFCLKSKVKSPSSQAFCPLSHVYSPAKQSTPLFALQLLSFVVRSERMLRT